MFRAYSLLAVALSILALMFAQSFDLAIAMYAAGGLALAMGDECERKQR